MKTLSLTNPWAVLVAIGAKRYETRSWHTSYRGPIAIHASKNFPRDFMALSQSPLFVAALRAGGYERVDHLPCGAVIATARLTGCVRTESLGQLSQEERAFGNFSANRWAWILADVVRLPEPIPAVGSLGLWSWEPPV